MPTLIPVTLRSHVEAPAPARLTLPVFSMPQTDPSWSSAGAPSRPVLGPKLIAALRSAGANAHNFKVRIQATRALREIRSSALFEGGDAAVLPLATDT